MSEAIDFASIFKRTRTDASGVSPWDKDGGKLWPEYGVCRGAADTRADGRDGVAAMRPFLVGDRGASPKSRAYDHAAARDAGR